MRYSIIHAYVTLIESKISIVGTQEGIAMITNISIIIGHSFIIIIKTQNLDIAQHTYE